VQEDFGASDPERQGWALYDERDGRPRYWTRSRIVAVVTASFTGLRYERALHPGDESDARAGTRDDPHGAGWRGVGAAWFVGVVLVLALAARLAGGEAFHEAVIRLHAAVRPLLDRMW
jgi:hypothetical protein